MTHPPLPCADDSAEIRALADKCVELAMYAQRAHDRMTDITAKDTVLCFIDALADVRHDYLDATLRAIHGQLESDGPSYESVQPVETELGELERREKRADEMMARLEAVGKAT